MDSEQTNNYSIKLDIFEGPMDLLVFLIRKNEINIYPGLGHAFANPSGANYAPEQTKDAWNKTLSFMDRYLK